MKKLLLSLLLIFTLGACIPVNPDPPTPPSPIEPVTDTEELTGTWSGNLNATQGVIIPIELRTTQTDGIVSGVIELTSEPQETIGLAEGVVNELGYTVVRVSISSEFNTITFSMTGVVANGTYVGTTSPIPLSRSQQAVPASFELVIVEE